MLLKRPNPNAVDLNEFEAAAPELVRDLRALGRATSVDQPYLDRLGRRLHAQAAASVRPRAVGRLRSLAGWSPRPALAASLALALVLSMGAMSTGALAAGPEVLGTKVQQVVQMLANKLGVPVESIEVQSQGDGEIILRLPDGSKGALDLPDSGKGKMVTVPSGTVAKRNAILSVTGVVANLLGVSPEQLKRELQGRSIADVAQDHGVSPKTLADAIRVELQSKAKDLSPAQLDTVVNKIMSEKVAAPGR